MSRIFTDATLEQEEAYIEERRKFHFLAASRWPISWLRPAIQHKRAADILYEITYAARERYEARLLAEVRNGLPNGSVSRTLEGEELFDYRNIELLEDYLARWLRTGMHPQRIFIGNTAGVSG